MNTQRPSMAFLATYCLVLCGFIASAQELFPSDLPSREWVHFQAEGFQEPALGVIFRGHDILTNGMALGGIDTGCIDFENTGLLGYMTIFNTHVPRRGPVNLPFLGLNVGGQTWVLCNPQPKDGWGGSQKGKEVIPVDMGLKLEGVKTVDDILYWGHYPVADVEFKTDAPVQVGMRAWTPFLPGDVVNSMVPAILFEVRLRNASSQAQTGTIAISFPGPTPQEAGTDVFTRESVANGSFSGLSVKAPLASYVLGSLNAKVRTGGELGGNVLNWTRIASALPDTTGGASGSSAAVDFRLAAGKSKVVRFVLAWSAPTWKGSGFNWAEGNVFRHMYDKYYPDAVQTAAQMGRSHKQLLSRTLAWQEAIYTDDSLPVWLRDGLVNILYCITEDGFWAQRDSGALAWVNEADGLFGLCECPRGCPQIECIPCSFYGSQPLVYFFPELQLSTMRGYKHYQGEDGRPVWTFGAPVDMITPTYTQYQSSTNGVSLLGVVDRFLMCCDTADKKYTKEFYPLIRKTMEYNVNIGKAGNPNYSIGEQVVAMPNIEGNLEWFETQEPGWNGLAGHIAILRLGQLAIARRAAEQMGDADFVKQCDDWSRAAMEAIEKRLWDSRGYYLNWHEPISGKKSDLIFGYQLDGEWVLDHHGLPSPLPKERVLTILDTIKKTSIAVTKYGAVNYTNPDGTVANPGGYGSFSYFPPEALMLAMNYMYEGQTAYGIELARKVWHNMVCLQGYMWDVPNIMRGDADTGERTFGNDYYQDMMLWSVPAAIHGQDFAGPMQPGGLVDRVLKAAAGKSK
ncbi:MAG: hypothetical protein K1Y02_04795 [Candidatus Hydrogenedentes bacterium]|nr:hypothetical protein [Candidatus Hydrogenedentota bacterium]